MEFPSGNLKLSHKTWSMRKIQIGSGMWAYQITPLQILREWSMRHFCCKFIFKNIQNLVVKRSEKGKLIYFIFALLFLLGYNCFCCQFIFRNRQNLGAKKEQKGTNLPCFAMSSLLGYNCLKYCMIAAS